MEKETIINIGKSIFTLSFLLGNICLFGYLSTQKDDFAFYGFMLLIYGSVVNLLVIAGLLIYGFLYSEKLKSCMKSSLIILINIPIAIVYAVIGLHITNI
jgi:LIVCS family branched-chain amino acid:cation transporter